MKTTLLFLIALASLGLVACSPEQPVTAEQAREIERQQSAQAGTYSGVGNNQRGGL